MLSGHNCYKTFHLNESKCTFSFNDITIYIEKSEILRHFNYLPAFNIIFSRPFSRYHNEESVEVT